MKPTSRLFLAATLCASALLMPQARAQMTGDVEHYFTHPSTPTPTFVPPIARAVGREIENNGSKTPSPHGAGRSPKARATTTYRPSRAVSRKVQARLLAFVAKSNSPEVVAQLKSELQGDLIGQWVKGMSLYGLRSGDVADAMAANWVQSWKFADHEARTQLPPMRAVRRQLAGLLLSNAAFAKLSDAGRQEMAEGFIYSQSLQRIANYIAAMRDDKTLQKQIRDATVADFKKSTGLDLRTMQLTGAGFTAKS